MAIKKLKNGDLVRELGNDYVVTRASNGGQTGQMEYVNKSPFVKGDFMTIYFEKKDLEKMTRRKVSQVSKKLAEERKRLLK